MIVPFPRKPGPVFGLVAPELIPAALVEPSWLVCGACGYNGEAQFYIYTDKPWIYDPVCNCPIPATLNA